MHVLRGIQPVAKVTAVFVLVLTTASTLTLLSPQATHAEGFLLGKVRCLVRTVLLAECQKTSTQTPAPATPTPGAQPNQPAPSESGEKGNASSGAQTQGTQKSFETIALPEAVTEADEVIQKPVTVKAGATNRIPESEYIAYFNAYSPYAVQGQAVANETPIQASPEGWKIVGVAWYWWGLLVAVCVAIFASVKYGLFRRSSVLSKGG